MWRHAPRITGVGEILIQARSRRNDLRYRRNDLIDAARIDVVLCAGAKVMLGVGLVFEVVADAIFSLVLRRIERDDAVGEGEIVPFGTVGDGAGLGLEELKSAQGVLPIVDPLEFLDAVGSSRDRRCIDLLIRICRLARKRSGRAVEGRPVQPLIRRIVLLVGRRTGEKDRREIVLGSSGEMDVARDCVLRPRLKAETIRADLCWIERMPSP